MYEVIRFIDNYAWGISPIGATIYLGKEDIIRSAITNQDFKSNNPTVDNIIQLEISLSGKTKIKSRNTNLRLQNKHRAHYHQPLISNTIKIR